MTDLVRPPTLRSFIEAGCDVTTIDDLENYARIIVIGQVMPWPMKAKLALSYHETAEAWLRGEEASPFGPDDKLEATPHRLRHYLWLAEGLMEPGVAELFDRALPEDVRAVCWERLRELDDEVTAELEGASETLDGDLRELEEGGER